MAHIFYKYLDIIGAKCMIGNQNLQFTNASQLYQWGTKAKDWEYEQEVRLVMPNPSPMYAAFTPQQAEQNKEIWDWREIHHYPLCLQGTKSAN